MCAVTRAVFIMCALTVLVSFSPPVVAQQQHPDLQRGIAEYRQENYEEAIESFQKVLEDVPYSSLSEYYLGMTYKQLQNFVEARKHLRLAVYLHPKIKEAILELAELNYQLGLYLDALEVLDLAERENLRPGQTAFIKGLVLLAMDKNPDAVASFQRARELNPELVQAADYQTGLALLNEGELENSEESFNSVIDKDPDTDMAAFAQNYTDKIQEKKREEIPYRYYLGVHFQYDDNVLLRPEDVSSAEDITGEEDALQVYTGGLEYYPNLKGPVDIDFHYSFYYSSHHDLASYDMNSHTFAVVPGHKIDNRNNVGLALSYNYTWVDDDKYFTAGAVSPTYTHLFGENQALQSFVSYQRKEFLEAPENMDEDRDADHYSLNLGWFYFFQQQKGDLIPFMAAFEQGSLAEENRGYLNLSYTLSRDDTEGRNWDYIGNEGAASVLIGLHEKVKLIVSGDIGYLDFRNTHSVFGKKRRDRIYGLSTLLYYQFYKKLNLQLMYSYRRDDSNIALYDYDRNVYSAGVEYRF